MLPIGDHEVRLYRDPTRSQLVSLLARSPNMRGLANTAHVWFFDAMLATHASAERAMVSSGLITQEDTFKMHYLMVSPRVAALSSSYGSPRQIDKDFVLRCDDKWKSIQQFNHVMKLLRDPLVEEILKNKDNEPQIVFHGTNQPFDTFSHHRLGMSTGSNGGATLGFFFTSSRDEAADYAENAGKRVVSGIDKHEREIERLKREVDRLERIARRTGDWGPYELAVQQWEDLEIGATREDASVGARIIAAHLVMHNPYEVDFKGGYITGAGDFDQMIRDAKASGHDGVICRNINDSPKGGYISDHFIVFSPGQIRQL